MSKVHVENNYWYITTTEEDITNKKIQINFPPEDFVIMTGGSDIAEFSGYGMPYPVLQWIRGTSDEITFNSMIWYEKIKRSSVVFPENIVFGNVIFPENRELGLEELSLQLPSPYFDLEEMTLNLPFPGSDLNDKLLELQSLTKPIKKLGRPPICLFKWSAWFIKCMVVSITNIQPMFPAATVPHPLGYRFSVTLRRYVDYNDNLATTDYTHGWTKRIKVLEGDTYEMIAKREYGDPQLGVALRRLHPKKPVLNTGDVLFIPSKDWARTQKANSKMKLSHILSPNAEDTISDLYDFLSE